MTADGPNVISASRLESREGSQGKIAGLRTRGFFRTRSAPPVARAKREPSSSRNGLSDGDDANDREVEGGTPTILMPRPVPGCNAPSIILEQHSSISSNETGLSAMLVSGDTTIVVAEGGQPAAARMPFTANPTPETPQLTHNSKPLSSQNHSNLVAPPSKVTTSIPTLEAILLDRRRRLVVHTAASGGTSNVASSSTGGSVPPILYKDFAIASSGSTSPTSSISLSVPRPGSPVVGSAGKGTKFKSSPLAGGNRIGEVIAERVGAAYSSSHKDPENSKELEAK